MLFRLEHSSVTQLAKGATFTTHLCPAHVMHSFHKGLNIHMQLGEGYGMLYKCYLQPFSSPVASKGLSRQQNCGSLRERAPRAFYRSKASIQSLGRAQSPEKEPRAEARAAGASNAPRPWWQQSSNKSANALH
jgi:hypothetical protein